MPSRVSSTVGTYALDSTARLSASCQHLVEQDFTEPNLARVIVRSQIADPEIWPAILNHKCNHTPLTPSGLWADMAEVIARYLWRTSRGHDADTPAIEVRNLNVSHTLIAKVPQEGQEQWVEMETTLTIPDCSSGDMLDAHVHCLFREIKADGKKVADLAHCDVLYALSSGWASEWSHHAALIRTKINNLYARAQTESSGVVQHIYRQRAYELFSTFVDYGPKYQNMAEIVYDTDTLESTSTLQLQPDPAKDYVGPYYLDASCHLSGFICNAVEQDRDKNAFVSNGVDAMKISSRFDPSKPGVKIQNYVQMRPLANDKTVMCGDVWVLQDEEIVGLWEGVKFKKIPRKVLNVFLPPPRRLDSASSI